MKKILKNIIICILAVNLILSVVFNLYVMFNRYDEQLERLERIKFENYPDDWKANEQVATFPNNDVVRDFLVIYKRSGESSTAAGNLEVTIISIVFGIIIGLAISFKKNTKVKCALLFISLNFIFNTIMSIIWMQNNHIESSDLGGWVTPSLSNFVSIYKVKTIETFLLYTIIYFLIVAIIVLINKLKVEKLNKELKERNKVL